MSEDHHAVPEWMRMDERNPCYRKEPLTHWDKMAAISQTAFWNTFWWMKKYKFQLIFHGRLFLRVKLTIFHQWFRWWLGADQATSHYLNQWWLVYWFMRQWASMTMSWHHIESDKTTSIYKKWKWSLVKINILWPLLTPVSLKHNIIWHRKSKCSWHLQQRKCHLRYATSLAP